MNRDDLQRLSKEDLIELVLRLQRPDKTSRTSSKPPSTDRKERRERAKPGAAKPGHEGHSRKLCETPDDFEDHEPTHAITHPLRIRRVADSRFRMNRDDLQRLSKEDLIELVLRLQRPDKTSRTSSKPPSTDRKERRERAKPGAPSPDTKAILVNCAKRQTISRIMSPRIARTALGCLGRMRSAN